MRIPDSPWETSQLFQERSGISPPAGTLSLGRVLTSKRPALTPYLRRMAGRKSCPKLFLVCEVPWFEKRGAYTSPLEDLRPEALAPLAPEKPDRSGRERRDGL